jgi:glycine cleavage system H lipoate-binding protein/ABC-type phosphate transport system substrate-binding protein
MKTRIFLMISVALLSCNIALSGDNKEIRNENAPQAIGIGCTADLLDLTNEWAIGYMNQYPNVQIGVNLIEEPSALSGSENYLAFLPEKEIRGVPAWKMAVGREVVVPVTNIANPIAGEIKIRGISQENLKSILAGKQGTTWGAILGTNVNKPVPVYLINDPAVIGIVKDFLQTNDLPASVTLVEGYDQLLGLVKNNPNAIAICSLSGIMDPVTKTFATPVMILPIDRNNNGTLDYIENIYSDLRSFERGVWIGKYPGELTSDIYAVSPVRPADRSQIDFITWVLTSGQGSLVNNGFNTLVYSEIQSKLDQFSGIEETVPAASQAVSVPRLILFITAVALMLGVLATALFGYGRRKSISMAEGPELSGETFGERSIAAPAGLFYDRSHTWAFMEKDGLVKVGIDDFLQHITGPITRIEMRKPGDKVKKGEAFLTLIQKGKKLVLYAPVSGTILETNRSLTGGNTMLLNESPYGEGWIYRLEPASWLQEIPLLSMAGKYTKWLNGEFTRLKDFLASSLQSHKMDYAQVVLQDGGELKNNLLEEFGPEVWEDFQSKFIDVNK